jgi:NTE family protein
VQGDVHGNGHGHDAGARAPSAFDADRAPVHRPPSMSTLSETLAGRRFGLVLSAGFFGFFGHAGLLAAMEGAGLDPAAYAGTSAGALVAAMAAAGLDARRIAERLTALRREHFWDPAPLSSLIDLARGRGVTGLLAGGRFRRLLDETLPIRRFEEARRPLVLVTTDITNGRARVHDAGPLAEAVHASCAYPGLFRAVRSGGAALWDGGLVDKAPLLALAERVQVDALLVHYLPSASVGHAPPDAGYLRAMGRGMGALRRDHFELQARLCEARGLPVHVISPTLPRVSPNRLAAGADALAAARDHARRALAAPADESRPFA